MQGLLLSCVIDKLTTRFPCLALWTKIYCIIIDFYQLNITARFCHSQQFGQDVFPVLLRVGCGDHSLHDKVKVIVLKWQTTLEWVEFIKIKIG